MQNRINENGLEYALVGDYHLPNLALPEEHRPSENGGGLHREHLKEEYLSLVNNLILSAQL